MTWSDARASIVNDPYYHLKRDGKGKGIICPICGSGSGKDGTGPTTKDGVHFTCWGKGHCFTNSDVLDIIGLEYGLTTYPEKLGKAADLYGIKLDEWDGYKPSEHKTTTTTATAPLQQDQQGQQEEAPDFMGYYIQRNKALLDTDYHRGISKATLDRFRVGFDPEWKLPLESYLKGGTTRDGKPRTRESWEYIPTTPRLIIPTGKGSYIARDTRPDATGYQKMKVGPLQIFNLKGMYKAKKPVIIVEGEIDALSIIDAGGEAVALGSTSMTGKFLECLKKRKPEQPFILCLDKDEAGRNATARLREGLADLGLTFYEEDIAGGHKDPNEAYTADPEGFRASVRKAEAVELEKESVQYNLQSFLNEITASKNLSYTSTGFPSLDKLLDGGIYPGLYVVGAVSSLGKTTFVLQVADHMAQQGRDVLIFSLEMARKELIAKSVSRLTLINDMEENGSTRLAKTTRGILTGKFYATYSKEELALIQKSISQYNKYTDHLFITEGVGDVSVNTIREKVERYRSITGETPVVILDYLQILAPHDPRTSDKQNTDKAILELKRLSRDYGTPVIAISSFNRDSYTSPVNMAAFKESGSIEYGSDVLIGLQYSGVDFTESETEKNRTDRVRNVLHEAEAAARNGLPQKIQIKILKNRNGVRGDTILEFFPKFNYFKETEDNRPQQGQRFNFSNAKTI